MKSQKGFNSLSIHATPTISVALILLLLGIVAALALAANSITRDIKEHLGFDIIIAENTTADQINQIKQQLSAAPYIASFAYHSPQEALDLWQDEMGENLIQLLDVNPFLPEFEVNLRAEYACADSLDKILLPLMDDPRIEEINSHTDIVDTVNRNLSTIILILSIAALTLLPISFVLINNTVRLTIYSRRFTIHTMKLVGASPAFILRPFILSNTLQGIIAGIIASALLAAMAAYTYSNIDPNIQNYVGWPQLAIVFATLITAGTLICVTAAWIASARYIARSYDDLFR